MEINILKDRFQWGPSEQKWVSVNFCTLSS